MATKDEGGYYPAPGQASPNGGHPATDPEALIDSVPPEERQTYNINIPIRALNMDVAHEHLERLALYYTIFGVIFVLVGVVGIVFPIVFALAVEQLIAWLLVLGGAVSLLHFLLVCGAPGTTSFLLLGILHLGVGLWMLLQPISGSTMLLFVLAGWFLAHGVLKLLMACQVRSMSSWPAVLVSGIVSIILAFTILALAQPFGIVIVGIIFGADLLVSGLSMLTISCMAYLGHRTREHLATQEPLLHNSDSGSRAAPGA
eukprot:TRINITY_DN15911_c0_g1_i1.p1 TRINITY_DN15911_c0_g1~~TRINITY_DN15911_c0_g1_i1.p1  ORF type:complete len:258 (+),score=24.23 TRINITY_DN15911_c0_g1_i1:170-943(+)